MERPRGVNFVKTGGGRTSVRLGSIQRFLIRNLTRYSSSSRTGGTVQARAPLRSILSLWLRDARPAGWVGSPTYRSTYIREYTQYNAESPKQGKKGFNYIVKTFPIFLLFIYDD